MSVLHQYRRQFVPCSIGRPHVSLALAPCTMWKEGRHRLVLPDDIPFSMLENQVGDILPKLSVRDKKALEDGGITTIAHRTCSDSLGRHWHLDIHSWTLLEQGVRGTDLPQTPRQLAVGQVWQSFALDTDGKLKRAYSIQSITSDDKITCRLWGPETGSDPHSL